MKRVAIFIDGNNFYFGLKRIYGEEENLMNFNFGTFCNYLSQGKELIIFVRYIYSF